MKLKKFFTSILILVLVFLCFLLKPVNASFFDRDDDKENEIVKAIDEDERRFIWKDYC